MINRFWKSNIRFEDALNNEVEDILFERNENGIGFAKKLYYLLKPFIPRFMQIYLRQRSASNIKNNEYEGVESIYLKTLKEELKKSKDGIYFIWFWKSDYKMASVITHDVETKYGFKNVLKLADIDEKYGFRSSFGFVPERYRIENNILNELKDRGFEVAIHGLKHDGKLFNSKKVFNKRISKIEKYSEQWQMKGFRSPSLIRNADWMEVLSFEWDSSFPDWDPYEPQPGGSKTVFPFFISKRTVELPVTMLQDHTLFEILGKKDIELWKKKIEYIESLNGLINIVVHPDYIFKNNRIDYYCQYLEFIKSKNKVWHTLPRDVADWWRRRDKSNIKFDSDGTPYIDGPAAKDGVVTIAKISNNNLNFTFAKK